MPKYYQGKFRPRNPKKYKGDITNIVYRSSWELKFLNYCDKNESIIEYASEEIVIPYRSPIDNKIHRYFVDFYVKIKDKSGNIAKYLIEIKPKKQTLPPKIPTRKTKYYINEVLEYVKNQAKWSSAENFCLDRQWKFLILTENELKV
jgi:hypothetical protein